MAYFQRFVFDGDGPGQQRLLDHFYSAASCNYIRLITSGLFMFYLGTHMQIFSI